MKIEGKTIVITGGASGMGKASAFHLSALGASVAIFDVDSENGEAIASQIGDKAAFFKVDVGDSDAVHDAFEKVVEKFGSVDVLICCAAIEHVEKVYSRSRGLCDLDAYRRVINVNLNGTFYAVREAIGKMAANEPDEDGERGVCIMTASCAGHEAISGQVPYAGTKGAIQSMVLPLAREMSNVGIRFMSISPGVIDTPLFQRGTEKWKARTMEEIPFPKRAGRPEEYAQLAEFLITNPLMNGSDVMLDAAYRQKY